MHIARQTAQELVVVDSTRWISAICAAGLVVTLYFVIIRHEPRDLFIALFFLFFAIFLDLRKTFVFDAMRRTVQWKGRKVFKSESGEIPFDEITDIGMEHSADIWGPGGKQPYKYRLTIITPQVTIPMAYAYSDHDDQYSNLRLQILHFIRHGSIT